MTLLLILVLSGCTRLSIGNETVETKKEEKESIVKCDGEDNKTITDAENLMTSYSNGPDNDSNYVLFTFDMVEKYSALAYLSQKEDIIFTSFYTIIIIISNAIILLNTFIG